MLPSSGSTQAAACLYTLPPSAEALVPAVSSPCCHRVAVAVVAAVELLRLSANVLSLRMAAAAAGVAFVAANIVVSAALRTEVAAGIVLGAVVGRCVIVCCSCA